MSNFSLDPTSWPWWVWVILALIALILIWLLVRAIDKAETTPEAKP
jgi:membrane protein implicated in regulation of membrane protease activity